MDKLICFVTDILFVRGGRLYTDAAHDVREHILVMTLDMYNTEAHQRIMGFLEDTYKELVSMSDEVFYNTSVVILPPDTPTEGNIDMDFTKQ